MTTLKRILDEKNLNQELPDIVDDINRALQKIRFAARHSDEPESDRYEASAVDTHVTKLNFINSLADHGRKFSNGEGQAGGHNKVPDHIVEEWRKEARRLWSNNPTLSIRDVADKILDTFEDTGHYTEGGCIASDRAIRENIKDLNPS